MTFLRLGTIHSSKSTRLLASWIQTIVKRLEEQEQPIDLNAEVLFHSILRLTDVLDKKKCNYRSWDEQTKTLFGVDHFAIIKSKTTQEQKHCYLKKTKSDTAPKLLTILSSFHSCLYLNNPVLQAWWGDLVVSSWCNG